MEALFGNKTIEKILFALLVNEKCYATQLHRMLGTPLTPIQKGLMRLEKGKIITSSYEGKTRIYQLNPAYTLLSELEMLLKAAFHYLPMQEKKRYTYWDQEPKKKNIHLLEDIWKRLQGVSRVHLVAKNKVKHSAWNRKGEGTVSLKNDGNSLIFTETGHWEGNTYTNAIRWTLDRMNCLIGVEHLRFGIQHPVFLFHLAARSSNILESLHAHLCGEDTYFGRLKLNDLYLQFKVRTIGPKKNEEIEYLYT